mmetsp:Transcript_18800/g.52716  ORF Transcript_18800/g.52716 Transcript_18800/m.52716 type:complete len:373 (-) Transcript_18800:1052-2170(-)
MSASSAAPNTKKERQQQTYHSSGCPVMVQCGAHEVHSQEPHNRLAQALEKDKPNCRGSRRNDRMTWDSRFLRLQSPAPLPTQHIFTHTCMPHSSAITAAAAAACSHTHPRHTHTAVISSAGAAGLAHSALELQAHELVHLGSKLKRQLIEHLPAEARDDGAHRLLLVNASLLEVEELVLTNLAGTGLMLHLRTRLPHINVGVGVGSCTVADEHGVALGEVAGALGVWLDLHQTPVHVAGVACADALAHDAAAGVGPYMHHLSACVRLLVVVCQGHAVELAHTAIAHEHHRGVLPGDCTTSLHLRPRDLGACTCTEATLCHKVVDATVSILVTSIPVLDGGVLDLCIFLRGQLHNCSMQLVGVVGGGGAAFQV